MKNFNWLLARLLIGLYIITVQLSRPCESFVITGHGGHGRGLATMSKSTTARTILGHQNNNMSMLTTMSMLPSSLDETSMIISQLSSASTLLADATTSTAPASASASEPIEIQGLSGTANTIIFIVGLIPFLWATYEFWSRIAVGSSFGTGADSIQIRPSSVTIGEDGNPMKSRGQRVLGDDALLVAYFLFAVAIASVGVAVYSVVSSPPLPM